MHINWSPAIVSTDPQLSTFLVSFLSIEIKANRKSSSTVYLLKVDTQLNNSLSHSIVIEDWICDTRTRQFIKKGTG